MVAFSVNHLETPSLCHSRPFYVAKKLSLPKPYFSGLRLIFRAHSWEAEAIYRDSVRSRRTPLGTIRH